MAGRLSLRLNENPSHDRARGGSSPEAGIPSSDDRQNGATKPRPHQLRPGDAAPFPAGGGCGVRRGSSRRRKAVDLCRTGREDLLSLEARIASSPIRRSLSDPSPISRRRRRLFLSPSPIRLQRRVCRATPDADASRLDQKIRCGSPKSTTTPLSVCVTLPEETSNVSSPPSKRLRRVPGPASSSSDTGKPSAPDGPLAVPR